MAVGVLPIWRRTPLLSTPTPDTTHCPVLKFRGWQTWSDFNSSLTETKRRVCDFASSVEIDCDLPAGRLRDEQQALCSWNWVTHHCSALSEDRKRMSHCANWNLALVKKEIPEVGNSCCQKPLSCPFLISQNRSIFSTLQYYCWSVAGPILRSAGILSSPSSVQDSPAWT